MLNICYLSLQENQFSEKEKFLVQFISKERREHISRLKFDSDKKLSLYAELLTTLKIMQELKIEPEKINLIHKKMEKPFLANQKFFFNYSHSNSAILLCYSLNEDCGADLEFKKAAPFEIMPLCFCQEEINYVNSFSREAEHLKKFYQIWTQKEAFIKFSGKGFSQDTTKINTLSPEIQKNFYNFEKQDYVCSIYSDSLFKQKFFKITDFTERDLFTFFSSIPH